YSLLFHANFAAVDIHGGGFLDALRLGGIDSGVTVGESIFLTSRTYNQFEARTRTGIAAVAHELVHVMQYRTLGKSGFVQLYAFGYFVNKNAGMSEFDAYKDEITEKVADKVESALKDFLSNNPGILEKVETGQPLSEEESGKVYGALDEASVQGKFKVGFQFIEGFLVYVPPAI